VRVVHQGTGRSMRRSQKITPLLLLLGMISCLAPAPQSAAQSSAWRHLGPPGGNVISLAISAKNVIYLGTPDGHIFSSSDGAQHWVLRSRVTARQDAVVQKLLVNVQHDNEILAAVWFQDVREGGGLFISHDSGDTWTLAGLSGEVVRTVEQAPSVPDTLVAGTRSGVFRSADGARTWQRISPEGDTEMRNVDSLAIDPHDAQIIYVGTYHLPWKTVDAGKHWTAVATGMIDDSDVMSLRVDATSPARIFASACSGIYRSENAGAVWTKLQGIPFSSRRTPAIVQDAADGRTLYAGTTEGLWVTRDGGESWTRTTPRDWVVNDVVVLRGQNPQGGSAVPADSTSLPPPAGEILVGTESQGVLFSRDGGASFTPANEGFFHRITAALVSDPGDAQHVLAWLPGSPDALLESYDPGAAWQPLPVNPPAAAPADIARIFATDAGWWVASSSGTLWHYDATARAWSALKFAVGPTPEARGTRRVAPVRGRLRRSETSTLLPASSDILEVRTVGARVFVATAQALWGATLGQKFLRPITLAKETSPVADSALRMAAQGKMLWSGDAGKSWHEQSLQISANVAEGEVRWVYQLPARPSSGPPLEGAGRQRGPLLAGTARGLYRRDAENEVWRLVQRGLPAGEPIAHFFTDTFEMIAMRGGGLYVSRDSSQSWDRLDSGLPAGPFTGVVVDAQGGLVAASLTEGLLYYHLP
jgi:photosystem II stability/assembly factor-like uncharacterized protein